MTKFVKKRVIFLTFFKNLAIFDIFPGGPPGNKKKAQAQGFGFSGSFGIFGHFLDFLAKIHKNPIFGHFLSFFAIFGQKTDLSSNDHPLWHCLRPICYLWIWFGCAMQWAWGSKLTPIRGQSSPVRQGQISRKRPLELQTCHQMTIPYGIAFALYVFVVYGSLRNAMGLGLKIWLHSSQIGLFIGLIHRPEGRISPLTHCNGGKILRS